VGAKADAAIAVLESDTGGGALGRDGSPGRVEGKQFLSRRRGDGQRRVRARVATEPCVCWRRELSVGVGCRKEGAGVLDGYRCAGEYVLWLVN